MKYLVYIFLVVLSLGCSQTSKKTNSGIHSGNKDAEKLLEAGYLQYADSLQMQTLERNLIDSFDVYNEAIYRLVHVDAEALAEFGFDFFLLQLQKILERRNITLNVTISEENHNNQSYLEYRNIKNVIINGQPMYLYSQKEMDDYTFWDVAPRRFFLRINEILEEENKPERFYLLYGGNDLQAWLLSPKQFEIIEEHYKDSPNEIPYLP